MSANTDAWIPGAKKLFAADPYVIHVLEKENRLIEYDEAQVAPPRRDSRAKFERDHGFVDQKLRKYTPIIISRLEQLHRTRHGEKFWRKALSLSILRHVSLCYDLFQVCEDHLDPQSQDCLVLEPSCYVVPGNFDEHRRLFQSTDFGQEQLFSVYCHLFHPGRFTTWQGKPEHHAPTQGQVSSSQIARWRRISLKAVLRRLAGLRNPTMGIMNTYFSADHMDQLLLHSGGRIQTIPLPQISVSDDKPWWQDREELTRDEKDFDRFDRFVFAVLHAAMPRMFVEDFARVFESMDRHFDGYTRLRWVVCEGWIGNTRSSMALAVLGLKSVRHIYNEHNYLGHPFLGNNLKYILPLVDEYDSLGWEDTSIPNLVPGASLFRWIEGAGAGKEHELLFVSSVPNTRAPETNSSYGESGARVVPGYLDMNRKFFASLQDSTLATMLYRAYPAKYAKHALVWDQAFVLRDHLAKVKAVDDTSRPARPLMQASRLVIINYLSTSYLEALLADIPTIFLWNQEAYYLEERYADFFDELIKVKICHTDPVAAARFVEQIKDDPELWWSDPAVQNARRGFLETNMGEAEVQLNHLFSRARYVATAQ